MGARMGRQQNALSGLVAEETARQVRSALQALPERMRETVVLYDLEGLSVEEVARVLGCPVGTVKSRLFHGRLRLREVLQPYVEGGESRALGVR